MRLRTRAAQHLTPLIGQHRLLNDSKSQPCAPPSLSILGHREVLAIVGLRCVSDAASRFDGLASNRCEKSPNGRSDRRLAILA